VIYNEFYTDAISPFSVVLMEIGSRCQLEENDGHQFFTAEKLKKSFYIH